MVEHKPILVVRSTGASSPLGRYLFAPLTGKLGSEDVQLFEKVVHAQR